MACSPDHAESCLAVVASKAALVLQDLQSTDKCCRMCKHSAFTIAAQVGHQQSRSR